MTAILLLLTVAVVSMVSSTPAFTAKIAYTEKEGGVGNATMEIGKAGWCSIPGVSTNTEYHLWVSA
jgi:hypothetical protein